MNEDEKLNEEDEKQSRENYNKYIKECERYKEDYCPYDELPIRYKKWFINDIFFPTCGICDKGDYFSDYIIMKDYYCEKCKIYLCKDCECDHDD